MHNVFSQSQPLYPALSLLSPPAHLGGLSGLSPSLGETEQPNVVQSRSKGLVRIYKPSNAIQNDIGFLWLNKRGMYIAECHGLRRCYSSHSVKISLVGAGFKKNQTAKRYSFQPAPCIIASQREQPPYQHWVSERSRWDVAGTYFVGVFKHNFFASIQSTDIQSKSDQYFLNSENIEYNLTTLYPRAPPLRWVWALLAAVPAWSSKRFYTATVYNSTISHRFWFRVSYLPHCPTLLATKVSLELSFAHTRICLIWILAISAQIPVHSGTPSQKIMYLDSMYRKGSGDQVGQVCSGPWH